MIGLTINFDVSRCPALYNLDISSNEVLHSEDVPLALRGLINF